jgi:hypothetical protein
MRVVSYLLYPSSFSALPTFEINKSCSVYFDFISCFVRNKRLIFVNLFFYSVITYVVSECLTCMTMDVVVTVVVFSEEWRELWNAVSTLSSVSDSRLQDSVLRLLNVSLKFWYLTDQCFLFRMYNAIEMFSDTFFFSEFFKGFGSFCWFTNCLFPHRECRWSIDVMLLTTRWKKEEAINYWKHWKFWVN